MSATALEPTSSMTDSSMRLPAEWEPQAGVVVAWPHAGTDWAERLEAVAYEHDSKRTSGREPYPVVLRIVQRAQR